MMADSSLIHEFEVYGAWRTALGERIDAYRRWLTENDLGDAQTDLRLQQLVGRLAEIDDDDVQPASSGLPQLEVAPATELIPSRHEIIGSLARD